MRRGAVRSAGRGDDSDTERSGGAVRCGAAERRAKRQWRGAPVSFEPVRQSVG